MEKWKNITIIFLLAVGALGTVTFAKSSGTLLQEGLYAEEVDGDLDAAIRIYEQLIKESSAQRSHIAQGMYRLGMCYLKKQDEQRAKEIFGKLVANYSDQTKVVNKVKPLLEELGNADPAALMPPETLIYVETGSPGRQIETILNMLKGTPLENPLALLGGGKSGKSPGDIMGALMNPAMMAEFKKIRGMGVGINGISQNNPPFTAVLFPGKSDALRGLILAGLSMVGTPSETIEGMQTLNISGMAGAAYDDNIVIIARPAEQLAWSIKQYKGVTSKPTLASTNKSFAKVSKKARQENALTLWANVDEVFGYLSEIIPADMIPGEIRLADGIADFKNIDDLIVFLNIQENGIALEHNIAFKDGHRCIAYNMIRTPNLSRAGFEAVPSEAVGLVSIAFGEAGNTQSLVASKSIENFTGLDIGREIFANIEQINLFALPPDSSSNGGNIGVPPIAANLGLAVTSQNPQQTRQILTQLLTVANLVTGQSGIEEPENDTGKYQIGLVNNQKLYCYMNQMNKTTVLSLNPMVVETSVSAIKRRRSVCTAGPLNEAVNKLSPTTSKLVLVNVGGGIRVADAFLTATYNNPQNPAHKTLAQLAKACEKTSIQLGTDERINNLNVRLSIDQLPPLDNLFPVLMQLSQTDFTAKAMATKPQPREGATIGITTVSKLKWKPGSNAKSHKIYFGTQAGQIPLLAEVKSSSHDELPELEDATMYYWRVDEVWADGT
ncbi:MAG: tetratricopeptide repeat protein, partial [Planctomycetes bacterium]|nr:tetratricopeptide repeat protein [Planctomycetota bacterium]